MEDGSQDLSWLFDGAEDSELNSGNADIDFSEHPLTGRMNDVASPVLHNGGPTKFVDPADLHRIQDRLQASPLPPVSGLVMSPSSGTGIEPLSVMDEFFRSQGGWRPPAPCSHCRRLRLQCFMLQTTLANPNPVTACSSCVALYRHCSLAGPAKRQASTFETPNPVIGQLHGVYEDEHISQEASQGHEQPVSISERTSRASKRSTSRSKTSTRPLRSWFTSHLEHPYPTECEKEHLASLSGLRRTQIDNWFSNARRRKKQSEQATSSASMEIHRRGSPMPQGPIASMTPLERWKHSPPDTEAAHITDIERAMDLSSNTSSFDAVQETLHYRCRTIPVPNPDSDGLQYSLPRSVASSSDATSSCNSLLSYASSKRSHSDTKFDTAPRKRCPSSKGLEIRCAECSRTFTRKSDLRRHERAIHSSTKETWICANLIPPGESATIWRISQAEPECALCGFPSPDEDHNLSHEFVACADRHITERTFTRKDHLFQHLEKFHRCRRKWDGWDLDSAIEQLRHVRKTL